MNPRTSTVVVAAVLAIASLVAPSRVQAQAYDTVLTTAGGRLRGTVIVEDDEGVIIELVDGTTRKVPRAELMKVEYAADKAKAAPPAAAAPAPVAAAPAQPPRGYYGGTELSEGAAQRLAGRVLWVSGIATFGIVYPTTIGVTAAIEDEAAGLAAIPVAGPFAVLGKYEPTEGGQVAGLVTAGIFQSLAVIFVSVGLGLELSAPDDDELGSVLAPRATVLPAAPGAPAGASMVGSF